MFSDTLTEQEIQVVRLICEGKTSKRIAEALGISFVSAVDQRMKIIQKMDLVRQAIRSGLVRPSPAQSAL